ncbi:Acyl-coenzyme A:6-aminopenicillanic acid acyl-transferase [Gimesia panareensis]|uniref:Acyl-coenzyme A:6-aminopenicillanic acid acyl-transferase n=1 Tax=Gimesia panareensis TaxID=2527978 RepID=A0A518FHG1_9PLAN|nr:C45 family peptidase [Gimesia panareensis]QDV15772.1 Acyl-coenzyme A:6-aminopenicillanic acid acyl-transferase [Gimesia panareensis]
MSLLDRYPEIEVAGTPREMGRQLGDATREEIKTFCEVALQRLDETMQVSRQRAQELSEQCLPAAKEYSADCIEELEGVAEAVDVPFWKIMLLQVRNQFTPEPDAGCTSLSVPTPSGKGAIVAQNWDNDPALDPFTIMLTRRPTGKPALMTLTQAGLISYIGFNSAGIGACLNSLPAPSRSRGVPHYFTLRELYEAHSLSGAVKAIRRAERAIPANIMLATPEGPADLEVTIDSVQVLRPEGTSWITHTNHCLHPELCQYNEQFPELIGSHPRKARIDELLQASSADPGVEEIKAALRDHQGHPRSICRHVNDDPDHGYWQTVFSVIIEPEKQRMHVSRGTPCSAEYEVYQL